MTPLLTRRQFFASLAALALAKGVSLPVGLKAVAATDVYTQADIVLRFYSTVADLAQIQKVPIFKVEGEGAQAFMRAGFHYVPAPWKRLALASNAKLEATVEDLGEGVYEHTITRYIEKKRP